MLVDIQKQIEILEKRKWRHFLIELTSLHIRFLRKQSKFKSKILKCKIFLVILKINWQIYKNYYNNRKNKVETFSEKLKFFIYYIPGKFRKYKGRMLKWKIFFEDFTDTLVDIQILLLIIGRRKCRYLLITLKIFINLIPMKMRKLMKK